MPVDAAIDTPLEDVTAESPTLQTAAAVFINVTHLYLMDVADTCTAEPVCVT